MGHARAFLVTDSGIKASGILDDVMEILDDAGVAVAIFADVEANPSTNTVDRAAEAARSFGAAAVVALGGGSSLDAAKAVALGAANPGVPIKELDYRHPTLRPALPIVAVPTTAGTGAETNGFGVFEDTTARCKVYLGDASALPRVSILDPALTLGLPARATAATGIDSLVHGVESLTSRARNPVSEAYAHQSVRLVARWLPVAVRDGSDLEARAHMLLGSHLAGLALSISGLGLVHGVAHAVTARTATPHGIALAAVLRRVLEFNEPTSVRELAEIAFDLGVGHHGDADAANAQAAIATIGSLTHTVGVYRPLAELGCTPDMVPSLAATALADPVTRNTPRTPTDAQLRQLISAALAR